MHDSFKCEPVDPRGPAKHVVDEPEPDGVVESDEVVLEVVGHLVHVLVRNGPGNQWQHHDRCENVHNLLVLALRVPVIV